MGAAIFIHRESDESITSTAFMIPGGFINFAQEMALAAACNADIGPDFRVGLYDYVSRLVSLC